MIYFEHGGFENKGFVTPVTADDAVTYLVEVDFAEYYVWNTENGWVDLYGNSSELIIAIGKAIENFSEKWTHSK